MTNKKKILNVIGGIAGIAFSILIIGQLLPKEEESCKETSEKIIFYPESVYALYDWFEKGCPPEVIPELLTIPANQIMEQLLLQNENNAPMFKDVLYGFSCNHALPEDTYLIEEAYTNRQQVIELMSALSDSAIAGKTIEYVLEYFLQNSNLLNNFRYISP